MKKFYLVIFAIIVSIGVFLVLRKPDYSRIPVTFGPDSELPIAQVKIGNQWVPLKIDLGSTAQASILAATLKNVPKKYAGKRESYDFKGNLYEFPEFHISHIQMGNLHFKDVIVKECPLTWHQNVQAWNNEDAAEEPVGYIGRPLLQKNNLFFDFPHSQIIACDKLSPLIEGGFLPENPVSVPFQITSIGIILTFDTDLGSLRFLLDTGASVTAVRSGNLGDHSSEADSKSQLPTYTSSKFLVNSHDFGPQRIFLIDISSQIPVDGFLGVDFIRAHPFYIDFQNQIIYFATKG